MKRDRERGRQRGRQWHIERHSTQNNGWTIHKQNHWAAQITLNWQWDKSGQADIWVTTWRRSKMHHWRYHALKQAQISRLIQKNPSILRSTVMSIMIKRKVFGTTRTFHQGGSPFKPDHRSRNKLGGYQEDSGNFFKQKCSTNEVCIGEKPHLILTEL